MARLPHEQPQSPEIPPSIMMAIDTRAYREMMAIGMEPEGVVVRKGITMNQYRISADKADAVQKRLAIGKFSCDIIREQ